MNSKSRASVWINYLVFADSSHVKKFAWRKIMGWLLPVSSSFISNYDLKLNVSICHLFRSAVVRECCIVIAKIAIVQKGKMTRWAPRILEALFSVIRMKVEIMNISAHQAAKAVVRCVPDNKKLDLLNKLKAATLEKGYAVVRQR